MSIKHLMNYIMVDIKQLVLLEYIRVKVRIIYYLKNIYYKKIKKIVCHLNKRRTNK